MLLKWGHDVVVATDGDQAWSVLTESSPPDLAILDWMMPAMDGLRICKELRSIPGRPYTYILILTGRDHKEDLVETLEAGADDYLTKPFDARELKARLHSGKRLLDLQNQLLKANKALQIRASHDGLTGLLNREAVLEALSNECARSRRDRKPVGLILADIDHFKNVNDTYGHAIGDVVLRHTAHAIRSVVRTYDAVGRCGGEEFLVVLPGCDIAAAKQKAEQIRLAVCATLIPISESGFVSVTLSLGVVSAGGTENSEEVLKSADEALYQAKREGRNRVQVAFSPSGAIPKI